MIYHDGVFLMGNETVTIARNSTNARRPDSRDFIKRGDRIKIDDAVNGRVYWMCRALDRGHTQYLPVDDLDLSEFKGGYSGRPTVEIGGPDPVKINVSNAGSSYPPRRPNP